MNLDDYKLSGKYLQLKDIKINVNSDFLDEKALLEQKIRRILNLKDDSAIPKYIIRRRSIDARKNISLVFSILIKLNTITEKEKQFLLRKKLANLVEYPETLHENKYYVNKLKNENIDVLVIGMGPAGLFAALELARSGYNVTIIERGKCVEERKEDFKNLRLNRILSSDSNAQFGEGGAGTFSDGKLTSRMKNEYVDLVLRTFVEFGAPFDILYEQRPHIGSDILPKILINMRNELIRLGCKINFSTKAESIKENSNSITVTTNRGQISCKQVIIAIGHSARDSYRAFHADGISFQNKAFAMGFRIEHNQDYINEQQFGKYKNNSSLVPANYSIVVHPFKEILNNKGEKDRAIYSFCMCPGGEVIIATSSPKQLCVNGMSNRQRNSTLANSALLCTIDERDYGKNLFAGLELQEYIEEKTYILGGNNYSAPCELCSDFCEYKQDHFNKCSFKSTYLPSLEYANLHKIYPNYINQFFVEGIRLIDKVFPDYSKGSLLIASETRSSAPVRMLRDKFLFHAINKERIYPIGEGAGYSGGIVSSAVDGIKSSRKLIDKWKF